jgi:PPOX class probable F420-dependent enzyme
MAEMTQAQLAAFLAAPRHAILATNSADGAPQVSPVWYMYEQGRLYISAGANTVKVRNLRRDPRLSVCIDAGYPDSRYVILRGQAELVEPPHPLQEEIRWRIIRHYHATEAEARAYYDTVRNSASVLIVLTPDKILSQDYN